MTNINLQKTGRLLFLLFRLLCFTAGLAVIAGICYVVFLLNDDKGRCLSEDGGVWDEERQECRQDCLTWSWETGCVPITEENIDTKEKNAL